MEDSQVGREVREQENNKIRKILEKGIEADKRVFDVLADSDVIARLSRQAEQINSSEERGR